MFTTKNKVSILLVYLFLVISGFRTEAATYYFSSVSGNDNRSSAEAQNPETPWRSIQKLNAFFSSIQPGDKILFKSGETFFGELIISKSGTPNAPIVFGSYGIGEKPIITTLSTLTNWNALGGNVYETNVSSISGDLYILTLDDIAYAMGRYPNANEKNKGYLTIESYNNGNIKSNELRAPADLSGGEIVIRKNNWVIDRHFINQHSGTSINYNTEGREYQQNYDSQVGFGFFVQNHSGTLDQNGEWYFNKQNKTLRLYYDKGNPSTAKVQVAIHNQVVSVGKGISNINFSNLSIRGANENIVSIVSSSNISFNECEIKFGGRNGIHAVESIQLNLQNSLVEDCYNSGIFMFGAGERMTFKNNTINRTHIFPGMGRNGDLSGNAIYMSEKSHNGLIENNRILNSGYVGINFNGTNTNVINNVIDRFCFVKDDGAGIYTYVGPSNSISYKDRKVQNNIVINGIGAIEGTKSAYIGQKPQVQGIYMDENSSYVEIIGNTISNMASSGILIHNSSNLIIRDNNIFDVGTSINFVHGGAGNQNRNITMTNNNFLAKTEQQSHVNVYSNWDDVKDLGFFDNNVYSRPKKEFYAFSTNHPTGSGGNVHKNWDLTEWSKIYEKDINSKKSPIRIPSLIVKNNIGGNKFLNGSFDSGTTGIHCWSPSNNCKISSVTNVGLDGNALKVEKPSPGFLIFQMGNIETGRNYNLKFSAIGNKTMILKAYLRQSISPFAKLSEDKIFQLSNTRTEIDEFLIASAANTNTNLVIESTDPSLIYWLDNFVVQEVEGDIVIVDDYIYFDYNESGTPKTMGLAGNYVDLKGAKFSGSVTIPPFSSIILLKSDNEVVEPINPDPEVEITSPNNADNYLLGESINISATATNTDGSIVKVEFFAGATFLGTDTTAPYNFEWTNAAVGNHLITAKAICKAGSTKISEARRISVTEPANVAPTISITSIKNNDQFFQGDDINLNALASDTDGSIAKVEFFAGTILLGAVSTAPYSYVWKNAPLGNHTISAKATDDKGATTTSAAIQISVEVNQIEQTIFRITSPTADGVYNAGMDLKLEVEIANSNKPVSKVEYYRGSSSIGSSSTFPYSFNWRKIPQGESILFARLTYSDGGVLDSPTVHIFVNKRNNRNARIISNITQLTFEQNDDINFKIEFGALEEEIESVSYISQDFELGHSFEEPFGFVWEKAQVGTHRIWAIATDKVGNISYSEEVTVIVNEMGLITDQQLNEMDFNMGPNPTSDFLNLYFKENKENPESFGVQIKLISMQGTVFKNLNEMVLNSNLKIDVQDLRAGVYLLHINYGGQNSIVKKFIKNY